MACGGSFGDFGPAAFEPAGAVVDFSLGFPSKSIQEYEILIV
jgi:hypothetical protein